MVKNNFIPWYYSLWMVKVLENVFGGIICSFAVIKFVAILKPDVCLISGRRSTNMASPNFCYTCWRTTQQRKTAQTWDSPRLLIYRYSIISEILGFRHIPQIYLCHHFLCLHSWIGLMISSLNVSGLADRKFSYQDRACSPWGMMLCATSIGHDPYIWWSVAYMLKSAF